MMYSPAPFNDLELLNPISRSRHYLMLNNLINGTIYKHGGADTRPTQVEYSVGLSRSEMRSPEVRGYQFFESVSYPYPQ